MSEVWLRPFKNDRNSILNQTQNSFNFLWNLPAIQIVILKTNHSDTTQSKDTVLTLPCRRMTTVHTNGDCFPQINHYVSAPVENILTEW